MYCQDLSVEFNQILTGKRVANLRYYRHAEYDDDPYKGANKILRNEATVVKQSMPDLKKKKLEQRDFSDIAGLDRSLDVIGQGGVYSVMSPIDNLNQTKNS